MGYGQGGEGSREALRSEEGCAHKGLESTEAPRSEQESRGRLGPEFLDKDLDSVALL